MKRRRPRARGEPLSRPAWPRRPSSSRWVPGLRGRRRGRGGDGAGVCGGRQDAGPRSGGGGSRRPGDRTGGVGWAESGAPAGRARSCRATTRDRCRWSHLNWDSWRLLPVDGRSDRQEAAPGSPPAYRAGWEAERMVF